MPQSQSGLSINVPTAGLIKATKAAEATLTKKQHELLELMGDYLLEKIRDDYQTKSKGSAGEDGVTWDGLLPSSLRSRKRSSGQGGTSKSRQQKSRAKSQSKARSNDSTASKGGTTRNASSKSRQAKQASRKRVSPSAGNYRIGINTGAQIDSLKSKKGGDAGPSVVIGEGSVTVQAAMSYSKHFVKARPIVPEKLPEKWKKELEEKATEFAAKVLKESLNKP